MAEAWMKCTECRTDITYGSVYWQCSVSTCNRSRMPLFFCSVVCWDSHMGSARHRDAWAEEVRAPTKEAWAKQQASAPAPPPASPPSSSPAAHPTSAPVRRVVGDASPVTAAAAEGVKLSEVVDKDILIVMSKMKKYIKDRSGFNCSDSVAEYLSDHVRAVCDEAIRAAARDERKTVLDRDVPRARR